MEPLEPTVLHPRLGRRIGTFIAAVIACTISVGAMTSGALAIGAVALAFFGYALVCFAARLFVPHAYETEVDVTGLRVHNSFGRTAHDVKWTEIEGVRPLVARAPQRPGGGDVLVGFTLREPSIRWRFRPKGADGVRVDGWLPDPYSSYEEVVAILRRYIEASNPARASELLPPPVDLNSF